MTTPFGRRISAVLSRRVVGRYVVLGIGEEAAVAEPGQFYMLAAVTGWGGGADERPYLPRAISALYAREGEVGFLLEDVGPGTQRLCGLGVGEEVFLVGPLGKGFTPPDAGRDAILVGGGVGIPPLAMFQERWGGRALVGFRTAEHAEAASLFADAEVATDDGSAGHHGHVTDLVDELLEERHQDIAVLACGPPAMLQAVQARVGRHHVPAQLALEAPMACGYGACFGCVVDTVAGYKRVCVDGPVFDAAVLV
jgi:dihydroorotate dehydrogenase electron transfer subunit